MGTIIEKHSHCVSVWNGTMLSHGFAGGDWGISEQTQASPIEVPSSCVLESGQIDDSPSIKTDHNVVMGMIGTEEAKVEG